MTDDATRHHHHGGIDEQQALADPVDRTPFRRTRGGRILIGGEPKDAGNPAQEIVDHYIDNKDSIIIGAAIFGLACVALVFFAGYLRTVLRRAEGEGGMLSALTLVGAGIMATGLAIDATLLFAIAEAADDLDPAAVQTLQAFWDNDFMPIAVGSVVFLLSSGIAIVRYSVLPKWLGFVAIILGIVGLTPAGVLRVPRGRTMDRGRQRDARTASAPSRRRVLSQPTSPSDSYTTEREYGDCVKANYQRAAPFSTDAMALPVGSVEAALPFYQGVMGFELVERSDSPHKAAVLARRQRPDRTGGKWRRSNTGGLFLRGRRRRSGLRRASSERIGTRRCGVPGRPVRRNLLSRLLRGRPGRSVLLPRTARRVLNNERLKL